MPDLGRFKNMYMFIGYANDDIKIVTIHLKSKKYTTHFANIMWSKLSKNGGYNFIHKSIKCYLTKNNSWIK